MKCLLMNKNTKVCEVEFDSKHNEIVRLYEMYHIDYAPLSIYNAYKDKSKSLLKSLNTWFKGRGIPSWRKDLEGFLKRMQIESQEELLNKAYALSLSDQYWIKESDSEITWNDINFFTNGFEFEAYLNASLDSSSEKPVHASLKNPTNTTDGMLQKAWMIEHGKRVLVKGTYGSNKEEPFNEWLASQLCKRLGFDYCEYQIDWYQNSLVSKCENFILEDEEIISAYDIFESQKKPNDKNDYEHYISILEAHDIPNARQNVANMFIIDYLMMNTDRHMKNFGIIRDVVTLTWKRTTPIFDTGQSMNCDKYSMDMNFVKGTGKFFTNISKDYEALRKTIGCRSLHICLEKLDGVVEEYEQLLKYYQPRMDIADKRIEKLVSGLETRIRLLEKHIEKCRKED